ncbi:MAG: Crp/Fnr family transcriptional regulator [Cyclobacteriaceae bacterium]|nr:Crp/Fnr family transcriptional regulator [Cyclobacteriaceae bacterium]
MDEFSAIRKYISRFLSFTEAEWEVHQKSLTRRWLKRGEHLLSEGQVCNHVSFINHGYFRTYSIVREEDRTQYFAFEHDYITDYCSFVTRKPSRDNIIAMEDAEVLQLDHASMHAAFEQYPVWQKFGRLIAEHVFVFTAFRGQDLLFKTPEELYLQLMHTSPHVLERVPLKYIASYLGITPEALSRIRKRVSHNPNR